jgi:8-oxo-dGTP pyrophosphatase MutT (NUDIX family)
LTTVDEIQRCLERYSPKTVEKQGFTEASVLILLVPQDDSLHLLFTVRTEDVEHHKGQVSFPGGAREPVDQNYISTALRESFEELSLPPELVSILGKINDMWTPTGFIVSPVVGYIAELPELIPQPSEVSDYFTVPLEYFLNDSNGYKEKYRRTENDEEIDVWFYEYGKYTIWGVTAFIIRDFKAILEECRV